MPASGTISKATLQEVQPGEHGEWLPPGSNGSIAVQFNPQTLKVNYTNQKASGDQAKGGPVQFVGRGTTKLTCELVFDITVLETGKQQTVKDVRELTAQVSKFMTPKKQTSKAKGKKAKEPDYVPPGVRFRWGTFTFEGVMDSVDETLEFFSAEGTPLRATVAISISKQEITVVAPTNPSPLSVPAGTKALTPAPANQNLQSVAGSDYKAVGAANGIENLRMLPIGTLLDLSANTGISAALAPSGGLEASLGGSFGIGGGISSEGEISFR
jgi:contractile injection system tube protein